MFSTADFWRVLIGLNIQFNLILFKDGHLKISKKSIKKPEVLKSTTPAISYVFWRPF